MLHFTKLGPLWRFLNGLDPADSSESIKLERSFTFRGVLLLVSWYLST